MSNGILNDSQAKLSDCKYKHTALETALPYRLGSNTTLGSVIFQ